MKIQKIIKYCTKFTNEAAAIRYSNNTIKASRIILGDDNKYWIVTMAQAEQLIKAGYEEI